MSCPRSATFSALLIALCAYGLVKDPRPGGTNSLMLAWTSGAPVCHDYQPPYVFEGELHSVTFDIAASRPPQAKAEALATERVTQGLQ